MSHLVTCVGRFVLWDVLYRGTFCALGRFESRMFCAVGRLVSWDV
jgi:hypothetical protein